MADQPRFRIKTTDADLPLMARVLGVSEITAQVMAVRGLRSKKAAFSFLSPSLAALHDPFLMKDAAKAVEIMAGAATRREKITIYGDYDADGVMSTVILYKTLKQYGAEVDYCIPHRTEEGYGLNKDAVRRINDAGTKLLITADNGISALEEVALARTLGMRVVVIDHHEPGFVATDVQCREDVVPAADAVVDPRQAICPYPFKLLCAAGLCFKIAEGFCFHTGTPFTAHDELLALAAIATVCDIVPLADENRAIVKLGLDILNRNKQINPGLYSLITHRGYLDKPLDTFAVGFVIGPCINATGRLESAALSVRLLLAPAEDEGLRADLARKLAELNEERKQMTAAAAERALAHLSNLPVLDKVLLFTDRETHESIAGIVAGRLKETYHRPAIIFTPGENDAWKGSGRSVEGYNLFEALYKHRALFLRFGGHAMAAGLTLPEAHIPKLKRALNDECALEEADFTPCWDIDRVLGPEEITLGLSEELARLAPFGPGNPAPQFLSRGLVVESVRDINDKNTLIFTFLVPVNPARRLKGVCFGMNAAYREAAEQAAGTFMMDAVYSIETNVYNGSASVQVRIKEFVLVKA